MTARLFERQGMIIELLHQREVVEHGGDIEQLSVEGNALRYRVPGRPQMRPYRMVEERRRAIRSGDVKRGMAR